MKVFNGHQLRYALDRWYFIRIFGSDWVVQWVYRSSVHVTFLKGFLLQLMLLDYFRGRKSEQSRLGATATVGAICCPWGYKMTRGEVLKVFRTNCPPLCEVWGLLAGRGISAVAEQLRVSPDNQNCWTSGKSFSDRNKSFWACVVSEEIVVNRQTNRNPAQHASISTKFVKRCFSKNGGNHFLVHYSM